MAEKHSGFEVTGDIEEETDNTHDIGKTTKRFKKLYLAGEIDDDTVSKGVADLVPYAGATGNVNLGAHNLTTTGTIQADRLEADTDALFGGTLGIQSGQIVDTSGTIDLGTNITITGGINGLGIDTSGNRLDLEYSDGEHFIWTDTIAGALWSITDLAIGGLQLAVSHTCLIDQDLQASADVAFNKVTIGGNILEDDGSYLKSVSAFKVGTGIFLFTSGKFYATQLSNAATANNCTLLVYPTGFYSYRNIGDANPAFRIRQMHAGSTGDILQLEDDSGDVVRFMQNGNIDLITGAISSNTVTITASSDITDVSKVNTLFVNTTSGNVTLGGLIGGVDGQTVNIIKIVAVNDLILEHEEGIGGDTDDFFMHQLGDEIIDAGGVIVVYNGTTEKWYDTSHAKHV